MRSWFDRNTPAMIVIGIALAVILLIGVTIYTYEPPITSGEIINKEFVPYHEWTTHHTRCTTISNITTCTPYTTHHSEPDTWFFTIQGENEEGELRIRRFKVSESLYESTPLNKYYWIPDNGN